VFIGVDVGTTNCKAAVLNDKGQFLGYSSKEYSINYTKSGYAEQDAKHVWDTTKLVIREAIDKSGIIDVKALSISVQGDAIIPVNKRIEPLHPTILGMDYRGWPQIQKCIELFGKKEIFKITGMPPHPLNSLPKILWIKDNHPDLFNKTWKFMTYADFILSKLGAEPVIDYTMASRTMAFSLFDRNWSQKILNGTGIPIEKLSKPISSGKVVGKMPSKLASDLGLKKCIHLISGCHDQTAAALGAGVIREGIAVDSSGSAEVISTAFPEPLINNKMLNAYYPCYIHSKSDQFFTFALIHSGGVVYQWFRDQFCDSEKKIAIEQGIDTYELIEKHISSQPSNLFVFPHFIGSGTPTCDLDSKGTIMGLTMDTTKYDIARAILEGLAYEIQLNLEVMREAGIKIESLIAVGGGTKSKKFLKIKANITGLTLRTLNVRDTACLGAGILAAVGTKFYKNIPEAVKICVRFDKTYEPDSSLINHYKERYKIYRNLYYSLLKLYNSMNK